MAKVLYSIYRRSPHFMHRFMRGCSGVVRSLYRLRKPVIQVGEYQLHLDFNDNASFRYLADGANYEEGLRNKLLELMSRGKVDCFADVGAGYGLYSFTALPAVKANGGLVYAFEPDPRCAGALRKSIESNGLQQSVRFRQCLVGDVEGKATLHFSPNASTSNRSFDLGDKGFGSRSCAEIESVTLDAAIEGNPSRLALKIDVEGNEPRVLRGARKLLQQAEFFACQLELFPEGLKSAGFTVQEYADICQSMNPDSIYFFKRDEPSEWSSGQGPASEAIVKMADDLGPHEAFEMILVRG